MNFPNIKTEKTVIDKMIFESKALDLLVFGLESGIFDLIGDNSPEYDEIAGKLGFEPGMTEALLNIYASKGLLEKSGRRYRLTLESQEYLVRSSPFYQGDVVRMHTGRFAMLKELPELIRGNRLPERRNFWCSMEALERMAAYSRAGMVQNVTGFVTGFPGFTRMKTMCDLGGGHGSYSMALTDKNLNMTADIVDTPDAQPLIAEYLRGKGYEGRISVIGLDLNTLEKLEKTYDLVLTSHVLYGWKESLNAFFQKIFSILNPGGIFISNHSLLTSDTFSSYACSFRELMTRMAGYPSHFLSEEELVSALKNSGFKNFQTKSYEYGSIPSLLIGAEK